MIFSLSNSPGLPDFEKLEGRTGYRVRVAHYRIVYDIFDHTLLIEIIDLGYRKDIYGRS
mgnify:CR=1 FL=1